jgi:hypothetical protein
MNPLKGYYCILQFCPDLARLEAANVGVLLFCPDWPFLKARTVRGTKRIRQFFGREGHDWSRIESSKVAIEDRLEVESSSIRTVADLEKFIATRANLIQITPPRPMRVTNPERDLDELFRDLVGGTHRCEKPKSFSDYVLSEFSRAGIDDRLQKKLQVRVPVWNRTLDVPFAYQNGRFNLIRPAGFHAAAELTACKYAVEGGLLYSHPDEKFGDMQLVIVGDFGDAGPETKETVERLLREHNVRLFTAGSLNRLMEEIRKTGKIVARAEDAASNGRKSPPAGQ